MLDSAKVPLRSLALLLAATAFACGSDSPPSETQAPEPGACAAENPGEPNDSYETATPLIAPIETEFCGPLDHYKLSVPEHCSFDFYASGKVDALVLLDEEQELARGESTSEGLRIRGPAGGERSLVFRIEGTEGGEYDVWARLACSRTPTCPENDVFEGSGNQRREDATPIDFIDDFNATLCVGDDVDWYSLQVAPGCLLLVTVDHDHPAGVLTTTLRGSGSNDEISEVEGDDPRDTLGQVSRNDVRWGLKISGIGDLGYRTRYRLNCDLAELDCDTGDAYDVEDGQPPAVLSANEPVTAIACSTDRYSYVPTPGCEARVALFFEQDFGDLDLFVLDGESTVDSSQTFYDHERVTLEPQSSAPLTIEVRGFMQATNAYELVVNEYCDE